MMSTSAYIVPFGILLKQVGLPDPINDDQQIQITNEQLVSLIRKLLVSVSVDEKWYLATYPDVEQGIQSGAVKSAKDHFVTNGYFEGRLPGKVVVDEDFYISRYPDVAEGIDEGEIQSAQEHFETHGFVEGRMPFKV
jgi:hypothetical protein